MAKDKSAKKSPTPALGADPRVVTDAKTNRVAKPGRAASSRDTKISTIDDYLETVIGDKRTALDKLRQTIRSIVPRAEECISYRIPAFRVDGAIVAGFCATLKGCSYFPFSGSTFQTLAADLRAYDKTKSALHFHPDKPLPASLVRKLIKTRIAETR